MGCAASDDSWHHKYDEINKECALSKLKYEETLAELRANFELMKEAKEKAQEQGNLLRFKVEVMVNMLAIDEKKIETAEKRLEALKWVLLSQGISQHSVTKLLEGSVDQIKGQRLSLERKVAEFDMTGALSKMARDFDLFRSDIFQSFADEDGKIVASLSRDEFMRQLYSVTEHVSKSDVQLISWRFFDGSNVDVAEFLHFFTTPPASRQAKSAASVVRMSLDLLCLDSTDSPQNTTLNKEGDSHYPYSHISHRTEGLDKGVGRLAQLWPHVEPQLKRSFEELKVRMNGAQIMTDTDFKETLLRLCGRDSDSLKEKLAAQPELSNVEFLTKNDVDLLAERFEIAGRVHFGHFLQFFSEFVHVHSPSSSTSAEVVNRRPVVRLGASPFRLSSEWTKLKASSSMTVSRSGALRNGEEESEDHETVVDGSVSRTKKLTKQNSLSTNRVGSNASNESAQKSTVASTPVPRAPPGAEPQSLTRSKSGSAKQTSDLLSTPAPAPAAAGISVNSANDSEVKGEKKSEVPVSEAKGEVPVSEAKGDAAGAVKDSQTKSEVKSDAKIDVPSSSSDNTTAPPKRGPSAFLCGMFGRKKAAAVPLQPADDDAKAGGAQSDPVNAAAGTESKAVPQAEQADAKVSVSHPAPSPIDVAKASGDGDTSAVASHAQNAPTKSSNPVKKPQATADPENLREKMLRTARKIEESADDSEPFAEMSD